MCFGVRGSKAQILVQFLTCCVALDTSATLEPSVSSSVKWAHQALLVRFAWLLASVEHVSFQVPSLFK